MESRQYGVSVAAMVAFSVLHFNDNIKCTKQIHLIILILLHLY